MPSDRSPIPPTSRQPVLVAEDEPDIGELLKLILQHYGCAVTVVGNGEDAILAAQLQPFRFVMLDAMMPVMSGIEAAAVMRRRWPKMHIIMHTAMDEEWVRERFSEYYAYFRKPLEIERFLQKLPELLRASDLACPMHGHRTNAEKVCHPARREERFGATVGLDADRSDPT